MTLVVFAAIGRAVQLRHDLARMPTNPCRFTGHPIEDTRALTAAGSWGTMGEIQPGSTDG